MSEIDHGPVRPLGEWHGTGRDTSRFLSAGDHAVAYVEYQRAESIHGRIDGAMATVSERFDSGHGGAQVGTQHSLKSWEAYRANVADARTAGDPIQSAVQQKDLHRYTFTFPPDERYASGVEDAYQKLEQGGFTPVQGRHQNWWGNDSYQGINTVWEHRETQRRVEVQFHTPESYRVKQDNHPTYRAQRSPYLSDGETPMRPRYRSATRQMQSEEYEGVTVPPNDGIRPDLVERVRLPDRGPVTTGDRARMEAEVAQERAAEASGRPAGPEGVPGPRQGAALHGAGPRGPPLLPEKLHQRLAGGRSGQGDRDEGGRPDVERGRRGDRDAE